MKRTPHKMSRQKDHDRDRSNDDELKRLSRYLNYRKFGFIDIKIDDGTAVTPDYTPVDNFPTDPVKPGAHPPGIARVFLCPNEGCLDELEDYLEYGDDNTPDGTPARKERNSWNASNDSDNCPYELRDLSLWISHRRPSPGFGKDDVEEVEKAAGHDRDTWKPILLNKYDALFTFTELFFLPAARGGDEPAYGRLVQHKLYLFDGEDDRITIVWRCCNRNNTIDVSKCQAAFINNVLSGNGYIQALRRIPPAHHTMLDPFLLEVLACDLKEFERAVQYEIDPKLTTNLMDAKDSVLTDYFKAMEGRIYSFNRMKCMVEKAEDLKETWEYVCGTLDFGNDRDETRNLRDDIQAEMLRCASLVKHTKRLDTRYQDLFALNTTVSQSRQSFYVTILTVLAAVFLPLSLASAVLSMQTRFQELGPLLYDFFGVFWIFCTFAALCIVLVRYGSRILDKFWTLKHLEKGDYTTWRGSIKGITYSYIAGWTLILVSFLLGMFLRDESIDWRAYPFLGSGILIFLAAPFVVPVVDVVVTILCLFGACCQPRRKPSAWRRARDEHKTKRQVTAAGDAVDHV